MSNEQTPPAMPDEGVSAATNRVFDILWEAECYNGITRADVDHCRPGGKWDMGERVAQIEARAKRIAEAALTREASPGREGVLREALLAELQPLIEKAAGPNGWDWMFPIRVKPVDGKPTIASHKGGNLFRGYIATWNEADLLVALANAAPRIMQALAANSPPEAPRRDGEVSSVAHSKETITAFLDGVVGVVEASSYEHHMLWREYAEQAAKYGGSCSSVRYDWIENLSGLGEQVGTIADRPIWISLLTAKVGGHKLLFWHVTSPVADHDQCDAWLKANLPSTAFRNDGCINRSDPMNFSNVFPRKALASTDPVQP